MAAIPNPSHWLPEVLGATFAMTVMTRHRDARAAQDAPAPDPPGDPSASITTAPSPPSWGTRASVRSELRTANFALGGPSPLAPITNPLGPPAVPIGVHAPIGTEPCVHSKRNELFRAPLALPGRVLFLLVGRLGAAVRALLEWPALNL